MTLDEIRGSTKVFLTAAEVSGVLNCDPQYIRIAARTRPELLGFPVVVVGTRTRIPRVQFLNFLGG